MLLKSKKKIRGSPAFFIDKLLDEKPYIVMFIF